MLEPVVPVGDGFVGLSHQGTGAIQLAHRFAQHVARLLEASVFVFTLGSEVGHLGVAFLCLVQQRLVPLPPFAVILEFRILC